MKTIIYTFLTLLYLILSTNKIFGAEFTIEGWGTEKQPTLFSYDSEKLFIVWTSKVQNVSNLGIRSVGECGGTIEIIDGQQIQNIMCESRNKYGKFNFKTNKAKGDAGEGAGNANTQSFIFVGGDGVWGDFVGVKCIGAYFGMPESHFMWKGKCNVPDSLMRNTKEKIANFSEDN